MTTCTLFGRIAMKCVGVSDYVDWGVAMLIEGSDSPALRILAGLEPLTDRFEAEDYFRRATRELGIRVPAVDEMLDLYAEDLCRQLLDGRIPPKEALSKLCRVTIASGYAERHMDWFYVCDAFDCLEEGKHLYPSATLENCEELLRKEAKVFLSRSNPAPECG